jgi:hypothetical protein
MSFGRQPSDNGETGAMKYLVMEVADAKVDWTTIGFFRFPTIVVSALGWVNTSGWSDPTLVNGSYERPPADGILDFDFCATAPSGQAHATNSQIAAITALYVPDWVKGVRLRSSSNTIERLLPSSRPSVVAMHDGLPVPWPFPWSIPVKTE